MKNIFRLKNELNATAIKYIRDLSKLRKGIKGIKDRKLDMSRIFLSMERTIKLL